MNSNHVPISFIARERATGTYWIGRWVGPRAGKEKNS